MYSIFNAIGRKHTDNVETRPSLYVKVHYFFRNSEKNQVKLLIIYQVSFRLREIAHTKLFFTAKETKIYFIIKEYF